MTDRAELVEKVARAMEETLQPECCGAYHHGANGEPECCMSPEYKWPPIEDIADAAIDVVLEEAARVAKRKSLGGSTLWPLDGYVTACDDIADAIRGLKGNP
jgi:hypothetical protein